MDQAHGVDVDVCKIIEPFTVNVPELIKTILKPTCSLPSARPRCVHRREFKCLSLRLILNWL